MSLDIDWQLLLSPDCSLAEKLIDILNDHLISASRPSFIGPIQVTNFAFGSAGPDLEIRDIRDVWRAFEEADDAGDQDQASLHRKTPPVSQLDDEAYDIISANDARDYFSEDDGTGLDDTSIYSGLASPRQSVGAVGIGIGSSALHFGMGRDYASAIMSSLPAQQNPSLFSQPHLRPRRGPRGLSVPSMVQHAVPPSSGNSPSKRSGGTSASPKSPLPSVQLHFRLSHRSNLTLTLLTSLSINYPAPSFMSLPLRLTVTGLELNADIVLAYSSDRNRVYVTLVDEDEAAINLPLGERLLPSLSIESEIGHTDAHVLRNVGKVEKFIADVIRKTLVEELAFPSFQTIAL
ncbi:hypothetical protein BD324DRAFT_635454 [Kockovaella imperatae]|uniref:Mitochondrial distribution and morphology protein 12 n=1 Tax=Kockovaella imperatae TaxID=4999 RepID=A0A1Y1U8J5_9TREE|nr:hypothetical protein BD324DRAFT_635454 [Kockovaella imperatae]ORX34343.1 hypothetical protein BD324DRAFT_635454 [Kockovaella imperatae]